MTSSFVRNLGGRSGTWLALAGCVAVLNAADRLPLLLLDGRNNHDWRKTSPVIQEVIERSRRFTVRVATVPGPDAGAPAWEAFIPNLHEYAVVVSNFNDFGGPPAPVSFLDRLTAFVKSGRGFVAIHAAGSGFSHYPEMRRLVGLAWGLSADDGSAVAFDEEGEPVYTARGEGEPTGHGPLAVWVVRVRKPSHPVMRGMPLTWRHGPDEHWYRARGFAEEIEVLATAFAPQTECEEPILWTLNYGRGRVLSTLMGHDAGPMSEEGFRTILLRGCEWAATGRASYPARVTPDGKWWRGDMHRPRPPVVEPPVASASNDPSVPPSDAIVLFDGKDLSRWARRPRGDDPDRSDEPKWRVENGYMEIVPRTGGLYTREKFADFQLHLEWSTPMEVTGNGQGRGNSGVSIMGHPEIQVLDSHGNDTYPDGQAAALYGILPPLVNASRPPGEWQSYDLIYEAPRRRNREGTEPARYTMFHNGLLVHHAVPVPGASVECAIGLQNHGNPVRYRNIWLRGIQATPKL